MDCSEKKGVVTVYNLPSYPNQTELSIKLTRVSNPSSLAPVSDFNITYIDRYDRLVAHLQENVIYQTTTLSEIKFRLEQSHTRPNEVAQYKFFFLPN
jgi:hypothetical protein